VIGARDMSDFGDELRRLLAVRGIGVRELSRRVPCNSGHVSNLASGRKRPSRQIAVRLDEVLDAGGKLVELADVRSAGKLPVPPGRRGDAGTDSHGHVMAFFATAPGSPGYSMPAGWPPVAGSGLLIDVRELVMAAAHESSDRAAEDGSRAVPAGSIEQVQADVLRLARCYNMVSPMAFLADARGVRDLGFSLAERTRRPGQATELYLTIAQVCALMSVGSFDLAVWPAAIEQAHSAFVYAEMAGHRPLQAWVRGMQALNAYWCGRAREAVQLADAGLALAPPGTAQARLHCISGRAWSHLGAQDRTSGALAAADRDRDLIGEAGDDELHDVIAGEFGWGPARQAMCSATALLRIGDADGAADRAAKAIRLHPQDQTGSLVDMTARADLACAELARDRLDAADAALSPVWQLAPEHRRHSLVERLNGVAGALGGSRYASASRATELAERIEVFTADSAPRSLPPGLAGVLVPGSE